jgi:uncharacterized protein YecA (UPF0149 family)
MAKKIGRNEPCPCGSGKKYKRCCLSKDEAARTARHREASAPGAALTPPLFFFGEEDELDTLSNSVVDLINERRFDEAEAACQKLKDEYPDVIDWIHRTAMLHEARGEAQQAIAHYERCLAYMDEHPDFFEQASREPFQEAIKRLRSQPNALT